VSHITIVINRESPPIVTTSSDPASISVSMPSQPVSASVTYHVPHDATEAEISRNVRKLVKQVRNLGS